MIPYWEIYRAFGNPAFGTGVIVTAPNNTDTVKIGSRVYTYGTDFFGDSIEEIYVSLAATINSDVTHSNPVDTSIIKDHFAIYKRGSNIIFFLATTPGTAGNSLALEVSGPWMTISGATLSGGTNNAIPISGSFTLPAGASTEAKQDVGNTSLSSINTKIPSDPAREGGNLATIAGKDFATQATLALIKAKTDNIDVALSTRTKPSDVQLVDGSTVTQPISAVSLPLPADAATQTTLASINAKLQTLGQNTSINSVPVVLASNQPSVSVESLIQTIQTTGFFNGKIAKVFHLLGRRAGFTSTSILNDVKEFDNAVANIPVLSASSLDIISSNVNDTAAGTGVRKVKVVYINSSYNLVESPDITLNGTTLVTNVLTGVNAVWWMEATEVGSGGIAAGNIRLRINGGTTEVEQITAGGNKSLSLQCMIPNGYSGYISLWANEAINNDQDLRLRATVNSFDRSLSTVYHFIATAYLALNTNQVKKLPMLKFPPQTRIKVSTISSGTGISVRADTGITLILIEN